MDTKQEQPRKFPFDPWRKVDSQGWRASSEGGLLRSLAGAAALFCATLLLCISHPQGDPAAGADGSDEDVWQGTVTVVHETHDEADKTESFPAPEGVAGCSHSDRHVSRAHDQKTTTYSDFRLLRLSEAGEWGGTARVNVTYSGTIYTLDVHKAAQCYTAPPGYREEGYETTTSGSGVGQGQVRFFRTIDLHSGKATCAINTDAAREIAKIPEVGREWVSSSIAGNNREVPVKQERSLLADTLAGDFATFDCAPYGKSYSGQKRYQSSDGTSTEILTWNIHGALPETEVEIIPPKEYDQWEPQAGEDEKSLGNFIDVEIVAHKKGDPDAPPPRKVVKFKLDLEDTSREKGVDLNWPPKERATDDFDMKFSEENPYITLADDKRQSGVTKGSEPDVDFMVTVDCYDWGGYTKLHVIAELEDGSSVVGHVRGHPDQDFLTIPKDDNSNHIADWWEHWFAPKDTNPTADDDAFPQGDGDKGDGISLYEEYRGFHIDGKHERLSPEMKDVFIWDWNHLGPGLYTASNFQIHLIEGTEKAWESGAINEKVVNPNRGYGTLGPVYVIEMRRAVLDDGGVGETLPDPGVPKNVSLVNIDVGYIRFGFGSGKKKEAATELNATLGHELGHASNVQHHGEGDYDIQPPGDVLCHKADGTVQKLPCKTASCFGVAIQHGAYSGDPSCVLRYNAADFYEDPSGNCEWTYGGKRVHGRRFGYEPPGTTYCYTEKGSTPAGDAMKDRGECATHLCINSRCTHTGSKEP